jgi:hypothetical protein
MRGPGVRTSHRGRTERNEEGGKPTQGVWGEGADTGAYKKRRMRGAWMQGEHARKVSPAEDTGPQREKPSDIQGP